MTRKIILTLFFISAIAIVIGQPGTVETLPSYAGDPDQEISLNELTIYVIPSKVKYDWSSPRTLYKSFIKNYKRNLLSRNDYLLGHAFIGISSPKLPDDLLTGMRSASRTEQKDLLLKEHYGLSILGADLEGALENKADLESKIDKFSRKGRLAFIDLLVSDETMERLISFLRTYKAGIDSNGDAGARYGGAFWPRYHGEGAGCSAFAVSFLDLAGLLKEEFGEWLVQVNIPMDLIGGPYNDNHEVRLKDIRQYDKWAGETSDVSSGFEPFIIYDPSLMFEWINRKWEQQEINGEMNATPLQYNDAKGIRIDARHKPLPEKEQLFMEREMQSIFIDYYHQKHSSGQHLE